MFKIVMPSNLKNFARKIEQIKKKHKSVGVEVGVIDNYYGFDKRRHRQKTISVAEEALFNCKGVPEKNIPPRDYQAKTIEKNKETWNKQNKVLLKKGLKTVEVVEALGIAAKDATKATISNFGNPPNAPATIKRKGRNSPLVDFGDLEKAITFQVVEK